MMAAMRPMTWAAAVSPDFQPPMTRSAPIVEAASASRAAAWAASRAVHCSSSMSTAGIGAHGQPVAHGREAILRAKRQQA